MDLKPIVMKNSDCCPIVERFLHLMEDEKVWLDGTVSFAGICALMGFTEEETERCLHETFGVSGAEIMEVYRRGVPLYML